MEHKDDLWLIEQTKKGDHVAMNHLIERHMPTINQQVNRFAKAPLPKSAILGEGIRIATLAAKRYDPTKGAAFSTHLTDQLRSLNRYVESNKRIDRLPENKYQRVGKLKAAKSLLRLQLGRDPTSYELADYVGWPIDHVIDIDRALTQRNLAASAINDESQKQEQIDARLKETIEMKYYSWPVEKQLVFDYLFGQHGKPKVDINAIVRLSGLSQSKVYRIKDMIASDLVGL